MTTLSLTRLIAPDCWGVFWRNRLWPNAENFDHPETQKPKARTLGLRPANKTPDPLVVESIVSIGNVSPSIEGLMLDELARTGPPLFIT